LDAAIETETNLAVDQSDEFDLIVGELEQEISLDAGIAVVTPDTCFHPATCRQFYCC
jgi:hypothetical protein